jgi:hypothetical protein
MNARGIDVMRRTCKACPRTLGASSSAMPDGMTYAEAVAAAELDSQAYRPRASVVEDLLSNDGGLTLHPIGPAAPVEE